MESGAMGQMPPGIMTQGQLIHPSRNTDAYDSANGSIAEDAGWPLKSFNTPGDGGSRLPFSRCSAARVKVKLIEDFS
jgi:hypothetical protein